MMLNLKKTKAATSRGCPAALPLDRKILRTDIGCMPERGLICLAIIVCVCVASIAFLPFGAGPYTAVYGPASALRARRAFVVLTFVLAFVSLLASIFTGAATAPCGPIFPVAGFEAEATGPSSLTSILRC
jgi:hypothetical protein